MIWRQERHQLEGGRVLLVALPEGYDAGATDYPLVFCLDAQWTFGTACDASLNLGLGQFMPRVVVAGLGWDATTAKEVLRRRGEAYTPTVAEFPTGVAPRSDGPTGSGGGPRFLASLVDEVLPFLQQRYRVRADRRTFVGHSLSALFGVYTLLNRPDTFSHYLLASPSVWWDDRAILRIEEETAPSRADLAARVFISVGALEESTTKGVPMVTNARLLTGALAGRGYPNLDLTFHIFEGEVHQSTIPAAISRGLRTLHASPS